MSTTLGMLMRLGGYVRQFMCGLHGHDSLLHFEKGRMSLLCPTCGYESPGWDVKDTLPRPAAQQASGKRRVLRMPLLGERRAA